ncbi:hypothetical protein BDM02DRAFT_3107169 [Thelephora ganbajun]|uniref:Uncharacterized protein n=1 Tax=Thelephora ganbajun TaxID=370292 RepID=A0ACB6ZWF0_THEGA|nr:hypothetical protein BDM02DRAFT_3107169 [Thelephora ganbajun]
MIQSTLYGIYFVLFTRTIAVLFRRSIARTEMHRVMIATAIVMWIIATGHLSVSGIRTVQMFVQDHRSDSGPVPSGRFSNITNLFTVGLNLLQILVGDAFLLYRMAVVWGRDWRFYVFPLLLLAASMVTTVGVIHQLSAAPNGGYIVDTRWIISFIAMTLSTNIFCTSLIAVKIWKINSFSSQFVGHSLTPVMRVVIESGAIYSCTLTALLVCYLTKSWVQYLILDSVSPIVGCVFSMVIVRLGLGLCRPDGTTLHLQEHAAPSMPWQFPRRRSSEILKLTTEETTAVRDDPKSDGTVNSYQGQSLFPAAVDLSITEPHPAWRS